MDTEEKKESFEVKDKRLFNPDGTVRQEGDQSGASSEKEPPKKEEKKKPLPPPPNFEINFSTFVLSLASSIQINLGLIPHPATNKPEIDLVSAKQTIDILGMMEEKTKGNLSKEEEAILKQVLFELRMLYLEVSKK
ncbi:MAG: DUF1844 domain-containing protein [Deltaproteobacteria bacterium]|nr:DUF1844 domain-containing protein [Deltaproteobacteria bacterium]